MPEPKDNTQSAGNTLGKLMIVGTWVIVLSLMTLFFDDQIEQMFNPNTNPEARQQSSGVKEVILQRNRAGQYIASGHINHQPVHFIVDTGATQVSVSDQLANKLGLKRGPAVIYRTANGNVKGNATQLDAVGLGNITLQNIRGGINPGMPEEIVLLGMSFLKHLEIVQRDHTLILRQYP